MGGSHQIPPTDLRGSDGIARRRLYRSETHAAETLHGNVTCQLNLIEVCRRLGVHLTILGSGGVYEGPGTFTEGDAPNAVGSVYSRLRVDLEHFLPYFDNVLYLRVHFPVRISCQLIVP